MRCPYCSTPLADLGLVEIPIRVAHRTEVVERVHVGVCRACGHEVAGVTDLRRLLDRAARAAQQQHAH